jgi:hypothetical protein
MSLPMLLAAGALASRAAAAPPSPASYEVLARGPWQARSWAGRPFIFLSCAGDWSRAFRRFAHECRTQGLLTPTWEDPAFPHPVESAAAEWGWSVEPRGSTRR